VEYIQDVTEYTDRGGGISEAVGTQMSLLQWSRKAG